MTPTLTGGVGTAICFGGPASVAGMANPPGVSPLVPGGNCIVTAKPLLGCSNDGSEGDPESLGQADYFGGGTSGGGTGGEGNPNGGNNSFGIVNGNCGIKKENSNTSLNSDFINKYYNNISSGLGFPTSFETEYKDTLEGFNDNLNSGIDSNSLFSFNGQGVGEQSLEVGLDFANLEDGNFPDVVQIKKDRVSPFPSFLMDWITRQIEEIVTKFSDFPTIFIILPDFSGIIDTDWAEFGEQAGEQYNKTIEKENKNNETIDNKINKLNQERISLKCDGEDRLKCFSIDSKIKILETQKIGNSGKAQVSGIKAAYEFLGNVPIIELEPQQINIDIPFPDTNTLDKFIVDSKATLIQWKNEVNLGKINGNANSNVQNLISNLEQNIEIAEEYKQFPRKLTKLLNQKEVRINQVMCSVEGISEITSGWIGRNGKRFKAWVETYILIKSILKSWQLLIDVFYDYEAECQECKNERQDLLGFEFKLISMILPKFPVIQFPKWPDLILDLHNIRASINIKIPDVVITNRPLVLPNIPELTLPTADINVELDIPDMPLLPRFEFPELPDIPTLPEVSLPDLPPPPLLPKLFSELEGVLKILKLITKAMCLLKQLPFVPEWRAGDQIAF
ncbi:MAG: hypothetical protein Q9M97_09190 [Candidatus Gracilibacteria bacterium]|nr:hypothetical protein [Candidatus Gracilibacteria bacterium]